MANGTHSAPSGVGAASSQRRAGMIAPLVAASDTLQFLGSGMTVRFFSLFFWQRLGMRPIATNALYAGGPVGIAICAIYMQRVSRKMGRVLTTVVCRTCSVLLLLSIALVMIYAPPLPPSPPCPPSPPSSPSPVASQQAGRRHPHGWPAGLPVEAGVAMSVGVAMSAGGSDGSLPGVALGSVLESLSLGTRAADAPGACDELPHLAPDDIRWLVL